MPQNTKGESHESENSFPSVFTIEELEGRIKIGQRLCGRSLSPHDLVDIGDGLVVQYGPSVFQSEAIATEFIRQHTPIPLPRIVSYLSSSSARRAGNRLEDLEREESQHGLDEDAHAGRRSVAQGPRIGYLVMEKAPGVALSSILGELSNDQQDVVAKGLSKVMDELHRLDDPNRWGMVGKGGDVYHGGHFCWYTGNGESRGAFRPGQLHPMTNMKEYFLKGLTQRLEKFYGPGGRGGDSAEAVFAERGSVFSHGNLSPESILIDPTSLEITGIVKWGYAGWYPYWWDHMTTLNARVKYSRAQWFSWMAIYTQVFGLYEEAVTFYEIFKSLWIYGAEIMPGEG